MKGRDVGAEEEICSNHTDCMIARTPESLRKWISPIGMGLDLESTVFGHLTTSAQYPMFVLVNI